MEHKNLTLNISLCDGEAMMQEVEIVEQKETITRFHPNDESLWGLIK